MPFIIPQAEFTATNQSALNAQEATKLVVELKAEEPYGSIFCGLAVKWAATKSLCLDKALQEDKDFKAALSLYFNASIKTLRGIVLKTVKTAVEEGRIELLKADFIKLDAALAPLLKKEKPPEKKAASVASTSVSKLAAALKPAIVLATPDVPAATPSLAGILAHRGYWEANRAFYPGDLDRALRGYVDDVAKQHVGKDGYITVINGTKFLWREDLSTVASSMLRVAKETQKQQTEELIKAVKKALKAGSNKIYIPINNGSGHFVFIDIKKAADGNVKVELKDSMDPDAHNVSAAHKRNNQDRRPIGFNPFFGSTMKIFHFRLRYGLQKATDLTDLVVHFKTHIILEVDIRTIRIILRRCFWPCFTKNTKFIDLHTLHFFLGHFMFRAQIQNFLSHSLLKFSK